MTKGLMVEAALGLKARRKRISPASFGICRGALKPLPSRRRGQRDSVAAGTTIPTVDSTGLPRLDSRTIRILDSSVKRPCSELDPTWRTRPRKKKPRRAGAIARCEAMTSSDVLSFDIVHDHLDGNECDRDHYWRMRPRRAPQTVAESFAPLLNC